MRRLLFAAGIALLVLGVFWPWIVRFGGALPLGRLPGDINLQRPGHSIHVWLGTGILVSVVLSLVFTAIAWLLRR